MSSATIPVTSEAAELTFRDTVSDALLMVKRNLLHIPRTPELLIDVTVQPIIFVLLFRYVFGGAIHVEGGSYVNYLMAGIFVQTLIFATISSGIGLANDLTKGLIDRFRSLPMSRSAVVIGRTVTDLLRGMLAVVIMFAVGLAVGFRPTGHAISWIAAFALLLLFAFSFSWIGVTVGMLTRTPEAVQAMMFIGVFPLTFASSAFVPVETMPSWLRGFASHQPITVMIDVLRNAVLGHPLGSEAWQALAWSIGILVVFFPVAIKTYQLRTSD